MSKYKQTFAEAYKNIYESAAAREIDRTNTRTDSMDYQMYKKSAELLRKKDYKALGKHIHNSDTAPREYVMDVISKKEPATFKKIYGNQTGFLATMKPMNMSEDYEVSMAVGQLKTIQDRVGKIMDFLSGKSDDYNMEAWLQSKITSAEDKLNSVANYVTNNPEINEGKQVGDRNINQDDVQKGDTEKEKELKIKLDKEKDTDALEKQIVVLQGQLNLAKQKLENEKNKVVKPEANPETGEVPLRTGLANAILDKKMNTKNLVQAKKKKEIPVGGKTKIEVNPDKDIGNFSGGMRTNAGNLH